MLKTKDVLTFRRLVIALWGAYHIFLGRESRATGCRPALARGSIR